jgi:hypothetical protein
MAYTTQSYGEYSIQLGQLLMNEHRFDFAFAKTKEKIPTLSRHETIRLHLQAVL